jgi:hypothetical protein
MSVLSGERAIARSPDRKGTLLRRAYSSIITLAVLLLVLWLIWSRLHIVVWVAVPWWGLVLGGLALFLALDYLLHRVLRRP